MICIILVTIKYLFVIHVKYLHTCTYTSMFSFLAVHILFSVATSMYGVYGEVENEVCSYPELLFLTIL